MSQRVYMFLYKILSLLSHPQYVSILISWKSYQLDFLSFYKTFANSVGQGSTCLWFQFSVLHIIVGLNIFSYYLSLGHSLICYTELSNSENRRWVVNSGCTDWNIVADIYFLSRFYWLESYQFTEKKSGNLRDGL